MRRLKQALIGVPIMALALTACGPQSFNPTALLRSNESSTARAAAVQPTVAVLPTSASVATSAPAATTAPVARTSSQSDMSGLLAQQQGLEDLYARVRPSVVQIVVTGSVGSSETDAPNQFGGNLPGLPSPQRNQPTGGLGSGFVYDTTGNIVTNNHVVEGADTITVRFSDNTTAEAKLVGRDPYADLAVIHVDTIPKDVQPLSLANASELKVGQTTIAIGNPYGLTGTMTTGIISGLDRNMPSGSSQTPYQLPGIVQTDAAINPGNSGGPLLDLSGNVIGVNTAIESASGASAGIGFAVPADQVQRVIPQLIEDGSIQYAYLGVEMTDLTATVAKQLGLSVTQGALVNSVVTDGPAAKAGVKGATQQRAQNSQRNQQSQQIAAGGDVITAVDGSPVTVSEDVIRAVLNHKVGDTLNLTIVRDGKEQQVSVTLAERPTAQQQ